MPKCKWCPSAYKCLWCGQSRLAHCKSFHKPLRKFPNLEVPNLPRNWTVGCTVIWYNLILNSGILYQTHHPNCAKGNPKLPTICTKLGLRWAKHLPKATIISGANLGNFQRSWAKSFPTSAQRQLGKNFLSFSTFLSFRHTWVVL